jgi:hypothetical protein
MTLLEAAAALCELDPPSGLTGLGEVDPGALGDLLEAHGLAPIASYNLEYRGLGAGVSDDLRSRLLGLFQGVANDNVYKLVTLKTQLAKAAAVPVVLLDCVAYVDWLYPHIAFRPVSELRLGVRGEDGQALLRALSEDFKLAEEGRGGHTATLTDGRLDIHLQESPVRGRPEDPAFFALARPFPAFGPRARRPSPIDALLGTVADQAQLGLAAPLVSYVDLRELVRLGLSAPALHERADALGLSRALYGSLTLLAFFFPAVSPAALALRPPLSGPERVAVEALANGHKDPLNLRRVIGTEQAARLVLGV